MRLNIFQEQKESFQPSRVPMQWHMQGNLRPTMKKDQIIVINISGRGDKDCAAIARYRGEDIHE